MDAMDAQMEAMEDSGGQSELDELKTKVKELNDENLKQTAECERLRNKIKKQSKQNDELWDKVWKAGDEKEELVAEFNREKKKMNQDMDSERNENKLLCAKIDELTKKLDETEKSNNGSQVKLSRTKRESDYAERVETLQAELLAARDKVNEHERQEAKIIELEESLQKLMDDERDWKISKTEMGAVNKALENQLVEMKKKNGSVELESGEWDNESALKEDVKRLETELDDANTTINEEKSERIKSETTVAEQKKAMDELTKELEKAKKDLNKATEELWRRNGDENDRNLAINDLLDRIEEMAVEKATLRVKIEELEKENDSLEDKITSHVKNISHLEEWINVSLNCREDEEREIYKRGSSIDSESSQSMKHETELTSLREKMEKMENERRADVDRLNKRIEDISNEKERMELQLKKEKDENEKLIHKCENEAVKIKKLEVKCKKAEDGRIKALAQHTDDHKLEKELEEKTEKIYGLEEDLKSYKDQLEICKEENTKTLLEKNELDEAVSNMERAKNISETNFSKDLSDAKQKIKDLESTIAELNEQMKCNKEPRADSLGTKKRKATGDGQSVIEQTESENKGETTANGHDAAKKTNNKDKCESLDWKKLTGLARVKTTDGKNKTNGSVKEDEKGGKKKENEKGGKIIVPISKKSVTTTKNRSGKRVMERILNEMDETIPTKSSAIDSSMERQSIICPPSRPAIKDSSSRTIVPSRPALLSSPQSHSLPSHPLPSPSHPTTTYSIPPIPPPFVPTHSNFTPPYGMYPPPPQYVMNGQFPSQSSYNNQRGRGRGTPLPPPPPPPNNNSRRPFY